LCGAKYHYFSLVGVVDVHVNYIKLTCGDRHVMYETQLDI